MTTVIFLLHVIDPSRWPRLFLHRTWKYINKRVLSKSEKNFIFCHFRFCPNKMYAKTYAKQVDVYTNIQK